MVGLLSLCQPLHASASRTGLIFGSTILPPPDIETVPSVLNEQVVINSVFTYVWYLLPGSAVLFALGEGTQAMMVCRVADGLQVTIPVIVDHHAQIADQLITMFRVTATTMVSRRTYPTLFR
jgi:hypothetical protein